MTRARDEELDRLVYRFADQIQDWADSGSRDLAKLTQLTVLLTEALEFLELIGEVQLAPDLERAVAMSKRRPRLVAEIKEALGLTMGGFIT